MDDFLTNIIHGEDRQAKIFALLCLNPVQARAKTLASALYRDLDKMERCFERNEARFALASFPGYRDPLSSSIQQTSRDVFCWNWITKTRSRLKLSCRRFMFDPSSLVSKETNELAVLFEGHAAMRSVLLFPLWIELERRLVNGLYVFHDGTARMDITGHVVQGLLSLTNREAKL